MAFRTVMIVVLLILYLVLLGLAVNFAWGISQGTGGTATAPADQWKYFTTLCALFVTLVTSFMGATVSLFTMLIQLDASRELERLKKIVEQSIPALGKLFGAAQRYYRALAPLQTGDFDLPTIEAAETAMKDVESALLYVPDEVYDAWFEFWQTARYQKEKVHKDMNDTQHRRDFWENRGAKELGSALHNLKKVSMRHLK